MKFAHNFFQGRAITMGCQDYITELVERKKGQHLQREERGAIQHLKNAGYSGAKFSPFIILYLAVG